MTPRRFIWLTYTLLVTAGALAALALYLAQAPHNPAGVTALACASVWLAGAALGAVVAYAWARGAES